MYLYDPRTNVSVKTSYTFLEGLTGQTRASLTSYKSRGAKLGRINSYLMDDKTTLEQRRKWYSAEKYENESWLPVIGSDGKFLVSTYGRVKRIYLNGKEKFQLPYQRKGEGNLFTKVWFKGKYGEYKIGHLVATHFIREVKPGEVVIRKNGIITDDYVGNLEICSRERLGKLTGYKSKSKPVVLLDPETMEVIEEYRSAREAGRKCFLSYQAVLDRCNKVYPYKNNDLVFMFAEEYEES